MKCTYVFGALAMFCLLASAGQAQPTQGQVEQLRQQVQLLEGKLRLLEQRGGNNHRVTQIGGGARLGAREPELVVRFYDLGDLFAMAPPYEAQHASDLSAESRPLFPRVAGGQFGAVGAMGGMGGGFFSVKQKPRALPDPGSGVLYQQFAGVSKGDTRSSIDDLISAITSTISPTEWDEVGGPGSIAPIGTSLMISAEEQTHKQIEALLNLFRKRWGTLRTVSVRARWLWLTDAQLAALLPAADDRAPGADQLRAYGLVDEAAWEKLLANLREDDQQPGGYRAVLTCYNGQTVHVLSGAQSLVVTGMIPVVGGGGEGAGESVGYQPQVAMIQEGAALQLTPIVNVSGKFVLLDVHSRVVQRHEDPRAAHPAAKPRPDQPTSPVTDVAAAIDRPLLVAHRFSTTVRIPVERRMLVGGMTYDSVPQPGQANLYLFLKVSVQELRDDQADTKPRISPEPKPEKAPQQGS